MKLTGFFCVREAVIQFRHHFLTVLNSKCLYPCMCMQCMDTNYNYWTVYKLYYFNKEVFLLLKLFERLRRPYSKPSSTSLTRKNERKV